MLIADASRLQAVLKRVKDLRGGTDREAATVLGVSQPTFTRLRSGKTSGFIRFGTYEKIHRALEKDPVEFGLLGSFEASLISGDAWLAVQEYDTWAARERHRLESLGAGRVLEELCAQEPYRKHFDRLLRKASRPIPPEPDDHRSWIALYRMVEPLAASELTGGVELNWREMQEKEEEDLHFYLRAAERCQRALLGREAPLQRVGNRELHASEDYKAWLAGVGEPGDELGWPVPPGFWEEVLSAGEESGSEEIPGNGVD